MSALPAGQARQGDCIARMRAMPSRSVDFILTDPPYLVRYRSREGRNVAIDANDDWPKQPSRQCIASWRSGRFYVSPSSTTSPPR